MFTQLLKDNPNYYNFHSISAFGSHILEIEGTSQNLNNKASVKQCLNNILMLIIQFFNTGFTSINVVIKGLMHKVIVDVPEVHERKIVIQYHISDKKLIAKSNK